MAQKAGLWLLLTGLALAVVLAADKAAAQDAETLRGRILEAIELYNSPQIEGAPPPYSFSDLVVEPEGEAFRVTVMDAKYSLHELREVAYGDVSYTMTPAVDVGGDSAYRISDLSIASPVTIYDFDETGARKQAIAVTFDNLSFEGLWSFAYWTLLSMDLVADNLALHGQNGIGSMQLGELTSDIRSFQKQGNAYDMTFNLRAKAFALDAEEFNVEIGEVASLMRVTDYDLAEALAFSREIKASSNAGTKPEDLVTEIVGLMVAADIWPATSDVQIDLADFKATDGTSSSTTQLAHLGLGFGLEDAGNSKAKMGLRMTQRGLEIEGDPQLSDPLSQGLLPRDVALKIDVGNLPLKEMGTVMLPVLREAMALQTLPSDDPVAGNDALDLLMGPAFGEISQILARAGAEVTIADSHLRSDVVQSEMGGRFDVDPNAVFGAHGDLTIEVTGLDDLVTLSQKALQSQDDAVRQNAANVFGALGFLQAYSNRGQTEDGTVVDRYTITLEPSGALAVNGQPLLGASQ